MELNDLFAYTPEKQLQEAPYSIGSSIKDSTIGKIFDRDRSAGRKEAGKLANSMMPDFKRYIGRVVGTGNKTIDAQHMFDYLQSKNINTDFITEFEPGDMINPKQAESIMLKAAQQSFSRPGGQRPSTTSTPRQPRQQGASNTTATDVKSLADAVRNLSPEDQVEFAKALKG